MRRGLALAACVAVALHAGSARSDVPIAPLRWSRALDASEGWTRVALPDDVLAACRPGLPDLRVRGQDGADVPFVLEQSLGGGVPEEWTLRDVESVPGHETTGIVDRGASPRPTDQATIELEAVDFLKPAMLEASEDARTWKVIATGSIFATSAGARMTTLRFAPNDRRYWRLRLDDRNGAPVTPRAVRSGAVLDAAPPPRAISLDVVRSPGDAADGESTYELTLPTANLTLSSLLLAPADAVFVRDVAVSERVLFRDEITRRVIGQATIARSPSGESLVVPLGELRGPILELAIEDGASPPLSLTKVTATVAPPSVLLYAPHASLPLTLAYGAAFLPAAHYDLGAALAQGRPGAVKTASLGAAVDHGAEAPIGPPPHGAVLDESVWQTKATIDLPAGGAHSAVASVAYLPLEGVDTSSGLRIVDATSHEVPYVFEHAVRHARAAVQPVVVEIPGRTTATLSNLAALRDLDTIELTATAPDYFVRQVTVVESVRDARGPTGERVLGSGVWERRPGERATPLRLAIATPSQTTITVRLDNEGNAPLTLGVVTLERTVRRLDFIYAPGDSLSLLTGNPATHAPSYDLALLGGALLALPAQAARLEPARDLAPPHAPPPKWFWVAVIAAGLGVAAALARALKRSA